MGMYDHIINNQVKCFYVPCSYSNDGVHPLGGELKYFGKGNEVPYKTLYYDYSPNFIVIDISPEEEEDLVVFHLILNGKVKNSYNYKDMDNKYFQKVENVIDYNGDFLTISKKEEALILKENQNLYYEEYKRLKKNHNILFDKWRDLVFERKVAKEERIIEIDIEIESIRKEIDQEDKRINPLLENFRKEKINIFYKEFDKEFYLYQKIGLYLGAIKDYENSEIERRTEIRNQFLDIINDIGIEESIRIYSLYSNNNEKDVDDLFRLIINEEY